MVISPQCRLEDREIEPEAAWAESLFTRKPANREAIALAWRIVSLED